MYAHILRNSLKTFYSMARADCIYVLISHMEYEIKYSLMALYLALNICTMYIKIIWCSKYLIQKIVYNRKYQSNQRCYGRIKIYSRLVETFEVFSRALRLQYLSMQIDTYNWGNFSWRAVWKWYSPYPCPGIWVVFFNFKWWTLKFQNIQFSVSVPKYYCWVFFRLVCAINHLQYRGHRIWLTIIIFR